MSDKKEPEIIDDLDLLGPIEDSNVSSVSSASAGVDSTAVGTAAGSMVTEERTTIIDAFALTGKRPVLQVTAGPDAGKQIVIDKEVFEMGRGTANDYVLHDLAISRRHIKFASRGETYSVIDQGSGNGTRVNGVKVAELVLHDGDEIAIGNTVMRFEWPVEETISGGGEKTQIFQPVSSIKKVKQPSKVQMDKLMPWIIYGGGGLVLTIIIIIVVLLASSKLDDSGKQGGNQLDQIANKNINAAIADINKGNFKNAQEKILRALTVAPENQLANKYKATIDKEIENQKLYEEAGKFIDDRKFKEANASIKKIPKESYFHPKTEDMVKQIKDYINAKIFQAEDYFEQKKYKDAKRSLDKIVSIEPDHKRAKDLIAKIEKTQKTPVKTSRSSYRKRKGSSSGSSRSRSRSRSKSSGGGGGGGALSQYTSLYKSGKIGQAISMLKNSPQGQQPAGKSLLKKMRQFQIMYSTGKRYYSRGDRVQAKKFLQKAKSVDRSIARKSSYSREISKMLKSL